MKKCPYCGAENEDNASQCKNEECLKVLPENEPVGKSNTSQEKVSLLGIFILGFFIFQAISCWNSSNRGKLPSTEDKSSEIATFIESKVNTGGYNGCSCRSNGIVHCNMDFPAGTSRYAVIANTQGVADLFAQIGPLAATIYYTGYSGSQKVCEFKDDRYSRKVTREF